MKRQPNIIFFFSDQQRADTVGSYGQKLNVTPYLDAMAAEGVRFENAFTCQPVCGPARACLQTGKYAAETGAFRNAIALNQDEKHLADYFNDAGYETAYVGKWHLASTDGEAAVNIGEPLDYRTKAVPERLRGGYKDFWIASDVLEFTSHGYGGYMFDGSMKKRSFEHYRADATTDFALEYLKQKDTDKPFFLMISYIEPHHQNDRNIHEGPEGSKEKFADYEVPGDLVGTEGNWRENYPDYLGCCNSLDMNLGRIRDEVERMGIADDTIIVYSSDHGSHFKTRNPQYKRSCHDSSIRIPMIAYGPGFTGGKVVKDLVSLIDLPATFLSSASIERPEAFRGRPLDKLVSGEIKDWPKEVFYQISENQVGRGIRTEKWKYSVSAPEKDGNYHADSDCYVEEYLYDLREDPHEKRNLIKEPRYNDIKGSLAKTLIKRMLEAGEKEAVIVSQT